MATSTYYFDGHDGISDPGGVWTSDTNAFDGLETGVAIGSAAGSSDTNALVGQGSNVSGAIGAISQVRARVRGFGSGSPVNPTVHAAVLSDASLLGTPQIQRGGSSGWSDYVTLTTPSSGWKLQSLRDLEVHVYATQAFGTLSAAYCAKVELEVTHAEANTTELVTYPIANLNDTSTPLQSDIFSYYGESFEGIDAIVTDIEFGLERSGSPSGTLKAHIYAHSGSFGTTGVPTGSPLASSSSVNVSTVGTSPEMVRFGLTSPLQIVDGTKYFVVIDATNVTAGGGNTVLLGLDTSSPSFLGNPAYRIGAGSWSHTSGVDLIFAILGFEEVTLSPSDTAHSLASESPTLAQLHSLSVGDALHSHSVEAVSLTEHKTLSVGDASHQLASDTSSVAETVIVTPVDAAHGLTSTSPAMSQVHILSVGGDLIAHAVDSPVLITDGFLTVATGQHLLDSDSPALTQAHILVVDAAGHAATSSPVKLQIVIPVGGGADSATWTQGDDAAAATIGVGGGATAGSWSGSGDDDSTTWIPGNSV